MAKKKPSVLEKAGDIFKEDEEELSGELFDVNTGKGMVRIKINRLIPNPDQPRKTFFEQTISELAESIKEHGVLSPIIVRPAGDKYEIIAGERRFKASRQAGLKEIPAIIKKASNGDARIISLIENIQREDLNDIDRAAALKELKANLNLKWEDIGQKLGLKKRRIHELVGLLDLPEEVQEDIRQKKITERHGRALRQLKDKEKLKDVHGLIEEKKLTGEQTQEIVKRVKSAPRRTIKKVYEEFEESKTIKEKPIQEPLGPIFEESNQLIKTLDNIKVEKLVKKGREELYKKLLQVQERITTIIKTLEKK